MKPLLVSHSDAAGGAARASYRLHRALRASGADSRLLVRRRITEDLAVGSADGALGRLVNRVRPALGARLVRLQWSPNRDLHSINALPSRWSRTIDRSDADVVNVHWVGSETISIADLGRIRKPTVLTLHDMWTFCGAEHYSDEAGSRWREGYRRGNRPPGHRGLDLDRWTWERKRRHLVPVPVVCPSRWLAGCASASALMADWPIRVIPYPLDTTVFRPHHRLSARRKLGLPMEGRIVVFAAAGSSTNPRKGFDLLVEALGVLAARDIRLVAVVVGSAGGTGEALPAGPVHWLGHVQDDARLAMIYCAADVAVVPSRQDNLPQTATEAQACGVPVVAFRVGGIPDAVEHELTGFLADPLSVHSLAAGIEWVLEDEQRRASLAERARTRAVELWEPAAVATEYREVYNAAIERAAYRRKAE